MGPAATPDGRPGWLARVAASGCVYLPKTMGAFRASLSRRGRVIRVRLEPCPSARPGRVYLFSRAEMEALGHPGREIYIGLTWKGGCLHGQVRLARGKRVPRPAR
jgi:hypothetical protein